MVRLPNKNLTADARNLTGGGNSARRIRLIGLYSKAGNSVYFFQASEVPHPFLLLMLLIPRSLQRHGSCCASRYCEQAILALVPSYTAIQSRYANIETPLGQRGARLARTAFQPSHAFDGCSGSIMICSKGSIVVRRPSEK